MENDNSDFIVKLQHLDPKELEKINVYYKNQHTHKHTKMRYGDKVYFFPEKFAAFLPKTRMMQLRPSDVFVASFLKSGLKRCKYWAKRYNIFPPSVSFHWTWQIINYLHDAGQKGTTWTQELVWLIKNDLDFEKATSIRLTNRYTFLESPALLSETLLKSMEKEETSKAFEIIFPTFENIDLIPSPRFFKTHLPMSLLPYDILDRAKVVYIARDPRDVAVSYYYHTKLFKICAENKTLKDFWELFIQDLVPCAPIFEHIKEAWRLRDHPNILFLFYEELSKDLPAVVRRVASFFGKKLCNDEIVRLCEYLKFENFKNNAAVNLEEAKKFGFVNENEHYIRKGVVGEWKEHFDVEMKQQAERWMSDNMRDSNLRFPQ